MCNVTRLTNGWLLFVSASYHAWVTYCGIPQIIEPCCNIIVIYSNGKNCQRWHLKLTPSFRQGPGWVLAETWPLGRLGPLKGQAYLIGLADEVRLARSTDNHRLQAANGGCSHHDRRTGCTTRREKNITPSWSHCGWFWGLFPINIYSH